MIMNKLQDMQEEANIYSKVCKSLKLSEEPRVRGDKSGLILKLYNILLVYISTYLQMLLAATAICLSNMLTWLKREKSLQDKVVLITGSGGYLGRYLAIECSRRGAILILWDFNERENKKTLEILKSLGYFRAHMFTVDVFDEAQLRHITKQVKEKFGDISMIIMAASPRIAPKSIFELDYTDDVEKQFLVGYMAQLWLAQEFLQPMIGKSRGHLVTISNSSILFDEPLSSPWGSLKMVVDKLGECLLKEVKACKSKSVHNSMVYMTMLRGGLAIEGDKWFEFSDVPFVRHDRVEMVAHQIMTGILRNKTVIFIPGVVRLVLCLRYLISPTIFIYFIYRKLFRSKF